MLCGSRSVLSRLCGEIESKCLSLQSLIQSGSDRHSVQEEAVLTGLLFLRKMKTFVLFVTLLHGEKIFNYTQTLAVFEGRWPDTVIGCRCKLKLCLVEAHVALW